MAGKQPAGLRSLRKRRAPPARMDRDGERNSPHPARNSQACYPIKLSSAYLPSKTSLRKQPSHHCAEEGPFTVPHSPFEPFTCPCLNIARIGCTTCPHQPFFRSQPYRRADRVRDCDACDRRSNPLPSAMTAIVSKISPKPHYGDEEMRAGAAWRGWCCLLTACHTQLGFTMRCAYSRVAYNCQAGRRSRSRC